MLILRTPKGWTGPAEVDGQPVEDTWRAHQVPMTQARENDDADRVRHAREGLRARLQRAAPDRGEGGEPGAASGGGAGRDG